MALDELKETDEKDDTHPVMFVMEKDLYDSMGEIKVEFQGNGYYVAPVVTSGSNCSSCDSCD